MADQPQREEETNCRGEESCMADQPQREEETNCRGEESCASIPRLLGRRTALCPRRANCRRLTGQWWRDLWSEGNCIFDGLEVGRKCIWKRKEMRKTGRYKIGCHVALEREVLGHPTLLEFLYFLCFLCSFCVWFLSNLCAVVLRFFTDFPGNTTYVKCVYLFQYSWLGSPRRK